MPWQGVMPVDLRLEFTRAYASGLFTMTDLCDQYAISRKTGYKWVDRYEADGRAGLADRSRRPHHMPRLTDRRVVEQLCEARRRHPTWSARKLIAVLRRQHPALPWPTRSTGCALLKAHGLVRARRHRRRTRAPHTPLPAITRANEVWTTDFKGEFRTGDGQYCYPLTVRDGFSRYVLRCEALTTKRTEPVQRQFARAFAEYGLPDRIRSDNGAPFAGMGLTRLSRLAVWWIRLGIVPERIALGHPEQNGSHEQFHRVLKAETTRPPATDAVRQQRRFRRFQVEYNDERPHEALHDEVPSRWYVRSRRAFPTRLPPVDYPGHWDVRRVSPIGQVSWRGRQLHLTEVLAGEPVGFEEVDDGIWMLYFATVRLARFDERTRTLTAMSHATR
jgi:transposase InsO family protein